MSALLELFTPASNVANVLVDGIVDFLPGITTDASVRIYNRAQRQLWGNLATLAPFSFVGGGLSVVFDAASGMRVSQIVSAGGSRAGALMAAEFSIPCGNALGANNSPQVVRPFRRYTVEANINVAVRGTAVLEFGLVYSNGFLDFLGTDKAYVLVSDPALNAGAWTPRVRLTGGGAITTDASSGQTVVAGTWTRYGIRYTEGPSPLLELTINGATVGSRQGLAAIPAMDASQASSFGYGVSAVLGTTIQRGPLRYLIEEL